MYHKRKCPEWSTDVKLFPLAYNSQLTTTLRLSPYEMVFKRKPRKPIMSQQTPQKTHKVLAHQKKNQFFFRIYHYIHTMNIIFITHKSKN